MRCTVLCHRRPDGTRERQAWSLDQSSIFTRDLTRHHAAFDPCVLERQQPELAFEKAGAAARIDDPTRGDVTNTAWSREAHTMRGIAVERDRRHAPSIEHTDAELRVCPKEHVLQASPIELKTTERGGKSVTGRARRAA